MTAGSIRVIGLDALFLVASKELNESPLVTSAVLRALRASA
jgi:hypothetical protein